MLCVGAVLLTSCASPRVWVKQGVTAQKRDADMGECLRLARREAQRLAWEHQYAPWSSGYLGLYGFYGYYGYPYRIWPYGGPWLYGQPFVRGFSAPDDTPQLRDFCMRAKGYSLSKRLRRCADIAPGKTLIAESNKNICTMHVYCISKDGQQGGHIHGTSTWRHGA